MASVLPSGKGLGVYRIPACHMAQFEDLLKALLSLMTNFSYSAIPPPPPRSLISCCHSWFVLDAISLSKPIAKPNAPSRNKSFSLLALSITGRTICSQLNGQPQLRCDGLDPIRRSMRRSWLVSVVCFNACCAKSVGSPSPGSGSRSRLNTRPIWYFLF